MIDYKLNEPLNVSDVIAVFESSGIRRPIGDVDRIQCMIDNSNFIYTAWFNNQLIGIARCLTDFEYCCYVSDLAIKKEFQKQGIGKELLEKIKKDLGDKVTILLLAAKEAEDYYPKIGFDKIPNGYFIKRKE